MTPEQQAARQESGSNNRFDPGDFSGGPPPDGGFMREAGGGPLAQNSGTSQLTGSPSGLGLPGQLVEALIQFLVQRSGSGS